MHKNATISKICVVIIRLLQGIVFTLDGFMIIYKKAIVYFGKKLNLHNLDVHLVHYQSFILSNKTVTLVLRLLRLRNIS